MREANPEVAVRAVAISAAVAAAKPVNRVEARRMDSTGSVFFRRMLEELGIPDEQMSQWVLFTHLVALLTPASQQASMHDAENALGKALVLAGLSETDFARLVASRGPSRGTALKRAVRIMSRQRMRLNVVDLAGAILWPDDTRMLAFNYYRWLDHANSEASELV